MTPAESYREEAGRHEREARVYRGLAASHDRSARNYRDMADQWEHEHLGHILPSDRACEFDLVDENNVVRAWGGIDREAAEAKAAELGLSVLENWRA